MSTSSGWGDTGGADEWTRGLDRRWPERRAIAEAVVATIARWHADADRGRVRVLELGCGTGRRAVAVLDELGAPGVRSFVAVDRDPLRIEHARERLIRAGHDRTTCLTVDLGAPDWTSGVAAVDVVYSMQTFHDLGGRQRLRAIYQQLFSLTTQGGLLVNADFVVPFPQDAPERPRRLAVDVHRTMLASLGFTAFRCEAVAGRMACMSAIRP